MKITKKTVVSINPYKDACSLACPFLNKDRGIPYCGKYKNILEILTYTPKDSVKRWYVLLKENIRRRVSSIQHNRPFVPFQHVYYERMDSGDIRLYIRTQQCKVDYKSSEELGKFVVL